MLVERHIFTNNLYAEHGSPSENNCCLLSSTQQLGLCTQVVVAEGAPMYGGHQQARQLAQAGINTTAIADSAIFAMMARVNKVRTKPPALCVLHAV